LNDTVDRPRRTLARDQRRQQVIEATIAVIASRGLARLTLTDVARAADISHGLVLFHFASKENLLAETLACLADEYQRNWEAAVLAAGPGPEDQLQAMIEADFHPVVTTPARLAAWCAFWGEAQSRPAYQDICGERDAARIARMEGLCAALVQDGGYALDAVHAARILRLVVEGIWLDMMTTENPYSAEDGRRTVETTLRLCFPGHFPGSTALPSRG
jgi:TetR/AcrR family transcriptional regulator, transcriptional repressor of bet genes